MIQGTPVDCEGSGAGSGGGADEFRHGLARYLAADVFPAWSGVDVVDMVRATGGLSWETFLVVVEDPARPDCRRRLVVKRPPLEGPLAPYDLTKQGVLVQALWAGRVPVAEVLGFTPEPVVAGRQVEVQSFVDGEIPDLRTIENWPAWQDTRRRDRVGGRVMELLAAVQSFDWRTPAVVNVLGGDRTVEDQVHAVVDRLMAKVDASVVPKWGASPVVRDGWLWLRDNVPALEPDDMVLVHGDFRVGNLVWRDDEIVALLDWERSTLGDPLHDLGFFCMPMARQRDPALMGMLLPVDDLTRHYQRATGRSLNLRRLHYYQVYWQYVELAQTLNAIAYLVDRAPVDDLTSLTSFPLLSTGAVDLVDLIERFEDGDHDLR
jgi:aminoglycoside phosphotransferase (APT) family kinase protein